MRPTATFVAAALIGAVPAAQADTFALGTLGSGPQTFELFHEWLHGPFDDLYTFSIGAGQSFVFDAVASTEMTNRSGIWDFAGALQQGSDVLAETTASTAPGIAWRRQIDFEPVTLGEGDYALRLYGHASTAFPSPNYYMAYDGTMSFSPVAAPIPEPATWWLFAGGGLGLAAWRRWRT